MVDDILTPEEVDRLEKIATACKCPRCRANLTWIASHRAQAARIKEFEAKEAERLRVNSWREIR